MKYYNNGHLNPANDGMSPLRTNENIDNKSRFMGERILAFMSGSFYS